MELPAPSGSDDSQSHGRVPGVYIVAGLVAVVAAIVGSMMWYARPKSVANLPPSLDTETGTMLLVTAGRFTHGRAKEVAIVPAFYMDRTEVSNAAFGKFCRATNRPLPLNFERFPADRPVVNVTFTDAKEFATWAGKRLPDALEWEKAATGPEARLYPWGDEADPRRANVSDNPDTPERGLMAVDSMPMGSSPYKLLHMAGNVFEYVRNEITPSVPARELFSKSLDPPPALNEAWFSVKGGSYNRPLAEAVAFEWVPIPARYFNYDIGFRCVKDIAR